MSITEEMHSKIYGRQLPKFDAFGCPDAFCSDPRQRKSGDYMRVCLSQQILIPAKYMRHANAFSNCTTNMSHCQLEEVPIDSFINSHFRWVWLIKKEGENGEGFRPAYRSAICIEHRLTALSINITRVSDIDEEY